jgi:hypothetical protein
MAQPFSVVHAMNSVFKSMSDFLEENTGLTDSEHVSPGSCLNSQLSTQCVAAVSLTTYHLSISGSDLIRTLNDRKLD